MEHNVDNSKWNTRTPTLASEGTDKFPAAKSMSQIKLCGLLIGLILTGCTDYQLKRNTLDAASTVETLYETQALANISRFIDNPDAIPS
jgi:hypothetical protein